MAAADAGDDVTLLSLFAKMQLLRAMAAESLQLRVKLFMDVRALHVCIFWLKTWALDSGRRS